jgi:hypothetical protein
VAAQAPGAVHGLRKSEPLVDAFTFGKSRITPSHHFVAERHDGDVGRFGIAELERREGKVD